MKNKTPITVLYIVNLVISGLFLIFNFLLRDNLRGLIFPSRYFGSINVPYLIFLMQTLVMFAAIGALIYSFTLFQKGDSYKAFTFLTYSVIAKIFIYNFLVILLNLLWGWYFNSYALLETFFSVILCTPLIAVLYSGLKQEAALTGNLGRINFQNLMNLNMGGAPASSMNLSGAQSFPAVGAAPMMAQMPSVAPLMPSPDAKWKIQVPGQAEQIIDTPTLQFWAKSGAIKSNFVVKEVASETTYLASQIPGVFSNKSYTTALLLSFFLGSLGVDRFYLGHVGLGIVKLFTFGGCGLWTLIDFILIAVRKVPDSAGRPLS